MKKKLIKQFTATITAITISVAFTQNILAVTYFEQSEKETIGRAMSTEVYKSVTDKGMLDVYVLRAPLNDPFITIKPVESVKESQLKEKTSTLLQENNAIAGVNGDFFNTSGKYSASIGTLVQDGKIKVVDSVTNTDKSSFSSLLIGKDKTPLISYIKSEPSFTVDGVEKIKVVTINKVRDMNQPICITSDFVKETNRIDAQFPGLSKIVVENGVITYIAKDGESVKVPENGFVILIKKASSDFALSLVSVGQAAAISVKSNVDFGQIEQAIGGGGKLLQNGQIVKDTGFVPKGRQPRTAIGINQDKTEIIFMVVDGRTHSIGSTHEEMGALMQKYGAYEAMHLDGGGSSTFVVKEQGSDKAKTLNTVSEGSERKVTNALAVIYDAPLSNVSNITVKALEPRVFSGTGIPVNIFGVDEYFNTVPLDFTQMGFVADDDKSKYENGYFYPSRTGIINLSATYNGVLGNGTVESKVLAQIIPSTRQINTGVGGKTNISFKGISTDGYEASIYKGVNLEISPKDLGHFEDGVFIADKLGAGFIKASVSNVSAFIDINVGYFDQVLVDFENNQSVKFSVLPQTISGNISYTGETVATGKYALKMDYNFVESAETQAAYAIFDKPIVINQGAINLKLSVYGNNSNHWLRVRTLDADGKEFLIDLAKAIDFSGWKTLSAQLPSGMKFPIKVDKIYTVSLSNAVSSQNTLIFDNLATTTLKKYTPIKHGADTKYKDTSIEDFSKSFNNGFDIAIVGNTSISDKKKPENYLTDQTKLIESARKNAKNFLFGGNFDIKLDDKSYGYKNTYSVKEFEKIGIYTLTGLKGGISLTSPAQYGFFPNDIEKSDKKVIVVNIDKNPLNFTHNKEFELFQSIMEKSIKNGKTVFVISSDSEKGSSQTINGVHYIALSGFFKNDKKINEPDVLRIRVEKDVVKYQVTKVKS